MIGWQSLRLDADVVDEDVDAVVDDVAKVVAADVGLEAGKAMEVVKVNGRSHTCDGRGVYATSCAAQEMAVDHIAQTEIDNHTDTCCFGLNFAFSTLWSQVLCVGIL